MIVVGYTNDQYGMAAVDAGIAEAALRGTAIPSANFYSAASHNSY